jgi:hypothetical protein
MRGHSSRELCPPDKCHFFFSLLHHHVPNVFPKLTRHGSTLSAGERAPGFATVPLNATDAEWAAWLNSTFTANSHPLGELLFPDARSANRTAVRC